MHLLILGHQSALKLPVSISGKAKDLSTFSCSLAPSSEEAVDSSSLGESGDSTDLTDGAADSL